MGVFPVVLFLAVGPSLPRSAASSLVFDEGLVLGIIVGNGGVVVCVQVECECRSRHRSFPPVFLGEPGTYSSGIFYIELIHVVHVHILLQQVPSLLSRGQGTRTVFFQLLVWQAHRRGRKALWHRSTFGN